MSPGTLKVTSAERPSSEIWPSLPLASGDSTSRTFFVAVSRAATSSTAARNAGSEALASPLAWTSTDSEASLGNASARAWSAVREEPLPCSSGARVLVPTMPPMTNAIATNASHPKTAVLRCCADQRPARAARLEWGKLPAFRSWGVTEASVPPRRRGGIGGAWRLRVRGSSPRTLRPPSCGSPCLEQDDQQDDDDDQCAQSDVHSAHVPTRVPLARRRYENGLSRATADRPRCGPRRASPRGSGRAARRPRRSRPRRRP